MTDEAPDLLAEVEAMKRVAEALKDLSAEAASRVVRWAMDAHRVTPSKGKHEGTGGPANGSGNDGSAQFESFADLYAAADPQSDVDRALVAGYWYQFAEGRPEFNSFEINKALKDLGHGLAHITDALTALKEKRPALVIQLKKAGTTRQARKTFKLTHAGKSAVEMMIGQAAAQ